MSSLCFLSPPGATGGRRRQVHGHLDEQRRLAPDAGASASRCRHIRPLAAAEGRPHPRPAVVSAPRLPRHGVRHHRLLLRPQREDHLAIPQPHHHCPRHVGMEHHAGEGAGVVGPHLGRLMSCLKI